MKPSVMWAVSAALAASLAIPAVSQAQTTPAPAGMAAKTSTAPAETGATPGPAAQRVEQRITDLHAQLGITAAQQTQWQQFAQVMRENAANIDRAMATRGEEYKTMTALSNMESYAALAQDHAENMQKLVDAFKPLYAALSPEQKHTADALFRHYTAKKVNKAASKG
jgi:LTXXQ motif family protein